MPRYRPAVVEGSNEFGGALTVSAEAFYLTFIPFGEVGGIGFPPAFHRCENFRVSGTKFHHPRSWVIIYFCYRSGYCGNQLGYVSAFNFPESYQTVFSKFMILNISIFLICPLLTFWETGKAYPVEQDLSQGLDSTRHKSHVARMTPENPCGKQTVGDWHMSLIKTYKANSSSSFGNMFLSLLRSTRWSRCFVFLLYQTSVSLSPRIALPSWKSHIFLDVSLLLSRSSRDSFLGVGISLVPYTNRVLLFCFCLSSVFFHFGAATRCVVWRSSARMEKILLCGR